MGRVRLNRNKARQKWQTRHWFYPRSWAIWFKDRVDNRHHDDWRF